MQFHVFFIFRFYTLGFPVIFDNCDVVYNWFISLLPSIYLIIYLLGFKFLKSQLWIPSVKYRSMDLRVVTLLRFKIFQHCKKIVYSIFNIDVVCDSVVERIILILYSGAYSRICSEGSILFFGLIGGQPLLGPQNPWKS